MSAIYSAVYPRNLEESSELTNPNFKVSFNPHIFHIRFQYTRALDWSIQALHYPPRHKSGKGKCPSLLI